MASKVQRHLLGVALKTNNLQLACHLALLASVENNRSVYLPNAYDLVRASVTPKQWAGYLSALQKAGKYVPSSDPESAGYWGTV